MKRFFWPIFVTCAVAASAALTYGYQTHYGPKAVVAAPATVAQPAASEAAVKELQHTLHLARFERAKDAELTFRTVVAGVEQLREDLEGVSAEIKAIAAALERKPPVVTPPTAKRAPAKKPAAAPPTKPAGAWDGWAGVLTPFKQ
jgi:hypothetical protein